MTFASRGELVPVGGGDSIPLIRDTLSMGRRETCDIPLRFANVSGVHCEMTYQDGYWLIRDMGSTNGIKVNGTRVLKKVLHPGDTITIAKRSFTIEYTPAIGAQALAELIEDAEDIMDQPLLQKAGLEKPEEEQPKKKRRFTLDDVDPEVKPHTSG